MGLQGGWRRAALGVMLLALSGCSGTFSTRYATPEGRLEPQTWRVTGVRVEVPDAATTTENNVLVPIADIVWHGDLPGNRKDQVAAILEDGLRAGARGMNGARRVGLYARIDRFHGVTPAAINQSPAAVHNIRYRLWVMDQTTGAAIAGPYDVEADLIALTRMAAVASAREGRSERQRIVAHLERVTRHWLGRTEDDPRGQFFSLGR